MKNYLGYFREERATADLDRIVRATIAGRSSSVNADIPRLVGPF